MKSVVYCSLVLCAAAAPEVVFAKPILLQTVDVEGMSTDGGEAKLYRATKPALAPCRIDVMLLGESGRAGWVFMFGSRLLSARSTDYRYNLPYYMPGGGKVASMHSITLRSAADRKQLTVDFTHFKGLFDPRTLAQCSNP